MIARDDIRWISAFAVAIAACTAALVYMDGAAFNRALAQAPLPALTFPAEVISCHDGDTVLVEIRARANVRLKDVWAAELRDAGGQEALAHIQRLTKSRKCLLFIPLEGVQTVGDVLTFGRVVGEIWMDGDCESVNMRMVRDGFATREKRR